MGANPNEIKAGIIIVSGVVVLLVFLFFIFGVDFGEETHEYTTKLNYVGGIQVGSLVKYGGMDVGAVTNITFDEGDPSKILLTFQVDSKTPVKTDSKAYVTSVGIMANQHIELSAGSADTFLLPSGSEVESKEVLSFTQMAEPLGDVSVKAQELMDQIIAIFDDENRAHLASMIKNMDKLIANGGDQFVQLVDNLEKLTSNLNEMSSDLNGLMTKNKDTFDQTLGHLETTTKETSQLIADLRESLKQFDAMLAGNSTSMIEIMENFQFASQNLEEFSRIVKERPWLLVRKAAPPERELP